MVIGRIGISGAFRGGQCLLDLLELVLAFLQIMVFSAIVRDLTFGAVNLTIQRGYARLSTRGLEISLARQVRVDSFEATST